MNKRRWFIGAIRTALENEEGAPAPENFDIKSVLMGVLVELEKADNPMSAMDAAMDNLSMDPQHYSGYEIEGPEDDDEPEEGEGFEIEEVEEGEPATPAAISSVLTKIASHIDRSKNPSRSRVVASLKNVMTSIRRHPHFKTAFKECGACGGKGKHFGWCPSKA